VEAERLDADLFRDKPPTSSAALWVRPIGSPAKRPIACFCSRLFPIRTMCLDVRRIDRMRFVLAVLPEAR
jgi:hypothetical protein